MIRTGQLLAEIAETLGYEVLGIDLFRTRLSTATKDYLREEVVLLRGLASASSTQGFGVVDSILIPQSRHLSAQRPQNQGVTMH